MKTKCWSCGKKMKVKEGLLALCRECKKLRRERKLEIHNSHAKGRDLYGKFTT